MRRYKAVVHGANPQVFAEHSLSGWSWAALTISIAGFIVLTDFYPNHAHELSTPLFVAILILCPPSLLSVLVIDAEIGTSGFYSSGSSSPCLTRGYMQWSAPESPVI